VSTLGPATTAVPSFSSYPAIGGTWGLGVRFSNEWEIFLNLKASTPVCDQPLERVRFRAGEISSVFNTVWRCERNQARKNAQLTRDVIRIALFGTHDRDDHSQGAHDGCPTRYFPERSHPLTQVQYRAFDDCHWTLLGPLRTGVLYPLSELCWDWKHSILCGFKRRATST
jgi:hypothetical protein